MTKTKSNSPLVSVIIPTRNSEKFLNLCLSSLKKQTYKNIEIIIVDNHSKDNTKNIAKKYTKYVFNKGPERTAQLNYGVDKAKGKYIYYTGADLIRDKTYIEEAVNKSINENCDAIYANVLTPNNPKFNIWQKVRGLERKLYFKEPGMNAARFYRKDVFYKLNKYDKQLGGISDDLEFQHRLNIGKFKTCYINSCEYNLDEYNSLKLIAKKSLYYGWLLYRYIKKFPEKRHIQYKLIRYEFIKNYKILIKNKIIFMCFIIYKIVQYIFGIIGYNLAKISNNNKKIEKILFKLNY